MKKDKKIIKGVIALSISFIIAGSIMSIRSNAATSYPAGAGTLAPVQSRGTLRYEIDGTVVQFCSSDIVALRNELEALGIWTATQFESVDSKMTTLENVCR